jgi:A/G-specific adenine glycosylase
MTDGLHEGRLNRALLAWFGPRRREFPWREWPPDAYRVLVSEIMLQQTQAARVAPAYVAFLARYPTAEALAAAPRADVVRAWAGLGYNRRAVALSAAARRISSVHRGRVPDSVHELRQLPGVGPYTAAAVASIAFGVAIPAIDTNVARVVARARLGADPADVDSQSIERSARGWLDPRRAGEWNQAVMDLGREACTPRPRCGGCPLASGCAYPRPARLPVAGLPVPRRPVTGAPLRRPVAREPFAGSDRQIRGAIVDVLRGSRGAMSLATLAATTGKPFDRVAACIPRLRADGLVAAGPAALAGRRAGRVRLADG